MCHHANFNEAKSVELHFLKNMLIFWTYLFSARRQQRYCSLVVVYVTCCVEIWGNTCNEHKPNTCIYYNEPTLNLIKPLIKTPYGREVQARTNRRRSTSGPPWTISVSTHPDREHTFTHYHFNHCFIL